MDKLRERVLGTIDDHGEGASRREFGDSIVNEVLGIEVDFVEPIMVFGKAEPTENKAL